MDGRINKNFCIVYDTIDDFINDPDVKYGMNVITLGEHKINDGRPSMFKVRLNSEYKKNLDVDIQLKGNIFAQKMIAFNKSEEIDSLKTQIKQLEIMINNQGKFIDMMNEKLNMLEVKKDGVLNDGNQ